MKLLSADDYLNGQVVLMDKPLGWTSFQVVNKFKWILKRKLRIKKIKIGHAGTLDPLATGLLILCTGKFTKHIDSYQAQKKTYTGSMQLGATTPSYDLETSINERFDTAHITNALLENTIAQFTGSITQTPPIFSALKHKGKRLYTYAREGIAVVPPKRCVHIYAFDIKRIAIPTLDFEVHCSKGTYIRSLAHDFGKALHSGAYLAALRRTKIGDFDVNDQSCIRDIATLDTEPEPMTPSSKSGKVLK